MQTTAINILKTIAKAGEVSLSEAIELGNSAKGSHVDQYPLARLVEAEFLGCTLSHTPPSGAESMREFSRAMEFHIFTVPPDSDGVRHYMGIRSTGTMDPAKESIFFKGERISLS